MALTTFMRAGALVVGAIAFAAQANAADLYAGGGFKDAPVYAPAPLWTGFYIGANAGAEWSDFNTARSVVKDAAGNVLLTFGGEKLSSTGPLGGLQLGYNWQTSGFVLGAELDLGGAGNNDSRTFFFNGLANPAVLRVQSEGGFYGDITGRLGYAWGPALLYAKGGFAWLDSSFKASYVDTAGAGFEYMLSQNWSMKVEYLYFDFNNDNNQWVYNATNTWRLTDGNLTANTVKLGFNYLFNHSYVPLK